MILPTLPVDFGNADEDGAIRLGTRATISFMERESLKFFVGMQVNISDGELLARADVTMRNGMWVAVVREWLEL